MTKHTVISVTLIGIVLAAIWTTLSYRAPILTSTNTTELPDGFMQEVNTIVMNKQGKPSMKIVTPKLVHYAEGDRTDLTMPELTIYRQSPQPWFITAKTAQAVDGIERIEFLDDVIIHHAADINTPATVIRTTSLTVYPNKKTAETKAPITMIQPDTIIKATGMFADLNTSEIKLLSDTRGEYAPTP